ncbi:MAG: hypothetical protein R3F23_03940 [Verrucomicrobiia bacterium]
MISDFSRNFVNQTFFFPTLAFNVPLTSTPRAAPGIRLRIDPSEQFYFQAAVYDGNQDPTLGVTDINDSNTRINLNEDEGALAFLKWDTISTQTRNPAYLALIK